MYPSIDKVLNIVPSKYQLVYIVSKRSHQMKETKHYQLDEKKYVNTKNRGRDYDDIIKDNNNYMIYDMTVKYISKKMRCESEIKKYLKSKEINDDLSDRIILKLRENGLLNDRDYVKCYISDKVRLNNIGLNKIKSELYKLKLDKDIVDEEINNYSDEDIIDNLEKLIDKKIRTNRSYGGSLLKQKIITDFVNKGYNKEDIIDILNKKDLNNEDLYNKEYNKLYNKYKSKYSGSELEYFIKQKLYSKGLKKSDD